MCIRSISILLMAITLAACTTGKLYYTTEAGDRKIGCKTEFVGLPKVDKYAVEYVLSLCAHKATKNGHYLDVKQEYLLDIDTSIPTPACNTTWDHKSAEKAYQDGKLSDKEYGYIVAHIDLGLAKLADCSNNR
ncbi:hypothetical protein [Vibrio sonorensis]|uniref:hypothetical protein n=1 Tax=Vibrio sonorensis TaxID=1004316 RepID=UPI0008D9DF98|nr:hypothetical protein [Vibrio sonorensis]